MTEMSCKITHKDGLHARPAAEFCKIAGKYDSKIVLKKDDEEFEAKSILMVLSAGAACGDTVTVSAEGEDEGEAVRALTEFLTKREV